MFETGHAKLSMFKTRKFLNKSNLLENTRVYLAVGVAQLSRALTELQLGQEDKINEIIQALL